jgi:NADPH:quinone reductase-like Zn-dependent oxidoreductase
MAPQQIKQWVTEQNGLDNLRFEEGTLPTPQDGQVLVKIHSVALNFRDTEVCMGEYNHHKSVQQPESIVPGSDMCGTVVSGNDALKTGTRVMSIFNQKHLTGTIKAEMMVTGLGLPLPGVLAEYRYFDANALVAVPDHLSDEEAACLPIAAVTAWMSINWQQPMGQPATSTGDKFVLLQGTGGVAISGLQIAHAAGFKTIITSSSDEKLEKAKSMGADFTINYRSNPEWQDEVMRITKDAGADIIFENGAAKTLRKSFDCIAFGGCISCIGYLSGKEDDAGDRTSTNVLALRRNVTLKGMLNGPKDRFEEMVEFYGKHQIHPVIDRTFKFEEAKDALKYLYSGSHFGKVVVKVAQ